MILPRVGGAGGLASIPLAARYPLQLKGRQQESLPHNLCGRGSPYFDTYPVQGPLVKHDNSLGIHVTLFGGSLFSVHTDHLTADGPNKKLPNCSCTTKMASPPPQNQTEKEEEEEEEEKEEEE